MWYWRSFIEQVSIYWRTSHLTNTFVLLTQ
ncbi:hypothetical protein O9993_12725 [Vibrio lentus]|nr:hypothetical protein [Vibrio lentus]